MAGFKYRRPTDSDMQRRADQPLGNYEGFIRDEYQKYSPKKGDNSIRILPRHSDEDAKHYGEDIWVHYNVGPDKASVLCPAKMAGEPCPLCEARAKAERRGDQEAVDELKPSRRVIMWMLDRKDEAKGPLVFDCPPTVDQGIAKQAKDRETGRYIFIDDPEQGYDIYFDREGEGIGTKYTGFQLAKRASSVDDKILDWITNNPLLDVLRVRSYDEINALFEGSAEASNEDRNKTEERRETSREPERETARETQREPEPQPETRREPEREREPVAREEPKAAAVSGADRAAALRARFAARNK